MKTKRQGFTLLELVLVVALVGVVTAVSYSILFAGEKSFEVGVDKGQAQADQRILREFLVKELRYASYLKKDPNDNLIKKSYDTYYSLELVPIKDDGLYNLKKIKYEKKNSKVETTNSVKMKYFTLVAKDEKVKVKFISETGNKQTESGNYDFTIFLENVELENIKFIGASLNSDLIKSETNKGKIYYSYPQHKIDKSEKEENY